MRRNDGNTLIELLVATVIVGVLLTGVAISLTYSIQREALNRYREGATSLAQEITEFIQLRRAQEGWDNFTTAYPAGSYCYDPNAANPTLLPSGGGCSAISRVGMDFEQDVAISWDASPPNKITATISLTWDTGSSTPKTYELTQEYFQREF